jgi:hypothetical protein
MDLLRPAVKSGSEALVRLLLEAGARSSMGLVHQEHLALLTACEQMHLGILRLLFATEHVKPSAQHIKQALFLTLCRPAHEKLGFPAAAELLLQQQVLDGSGAALLADQNRKLQMLRINPADVRMTMLRSWAAETAAADGQRAALVVREREVAAVVPGLGEALVGFALQKRRPQHHQQQHHQQQQQQLTRVETAQSPV